ncbi:MAG: ABC transporter permease [Fimbriimonadaceae bacterium]|nr:ABC transporter permease [Fimbriimonadaceae bacterium]
MSKFKFGKEAGILLLLVVLCVVVTALNPRFLSPINIQNTARLIGMFGILSLGLAVVIVTGGIDLSVGSLVALLGALLSIGLVDKHVSAPLVVVGVLLVGAGLGLVHGLLVTRAKLQSFIVTLCGLLIYRGAARFVAEDQSKGFGDSAGFMWLHDLAVGNLLGVPWPFVIFIAFAVVLGVLLHRSVYGRYLYAIGRNPEAARYSGVDVKKVETFAYVVAGGLAGVAAILFAFYTNSISPSTHGSFYELYAIAAAVLGGFSLRGGEGSVVGVVLGAVLLQVLQNLVNLLGIPSSLNFAVMGAVILVGVLTDNLLLRRKSA